MNLGSANLKTVTSSRPQLEHSNSKRSVAASDDYYSFSDYASDPSSGDDQKTIKRYKTPPAETQTPHRNQDTQQPEQTLPIADQRQSDTAARVVKFEDRQSIPKKPLPEDNMQKWRSDVSPPTPGVDDTPYIQFAIDQLTRDEELLGRRRDGVESEDISPISAEGPEKNPFDDRSALRSPEPIHRPQQRESSTSPIEQEDNILVPTTPQDDHYRYPSLSFLPASLRWPSLFGLIFYCLFMIVGLITSSVWVSKHDGLLRYDGTGTSRYFLFEFLPQLLASGIIIWLLVIQAATQRILPFVLLASEKPSQHTGVLHDVPLFLTNYLIPNLSSFRHGEPLLGACSVIFWLALFTVPLQSCVYQTRLYLFPQEAVWMWTVVQPVAWVLVVLYFLLIIAILLLFFRCARSSTGLKWDPVSLADIFILLRRSNITGDFRNSLGREGYVNSRPASLGYWQASNRPDDVFYGLGEGNAPARATFSEKGKSKLASEGHQPLDLESQRPTADPSSSDIHSVSVRYRWTPWFLRDTWVIGWIVLAFVLTIAFLVVSFVHNAVQNGFLPLLPAPTTDLGFSSANFLYSFLPSFLGLLLFLLYQPIDTYFRALQPFASLTAPNGATAEHSLLLNYTACLPIEVTVRAALNRHYRVAAISFVGLASIVLPILGGGIFTAQWIVDSQSIREVASMPSYIALIVFVLIYALSFLLLWPTRRRYLPHDISTLGDVIAFVHQSPLITDRVFREPRSKIDLVTRLLSVPLGEQEPWRYGFGVFVGRDGRERLGIDLVDRAGRSGVPVIGGEKF